jgi:hypothetical protein
MEDCRVAMPQRGKFLAMTAFYIGGAALDHELGPNEATTLPAYTLNAERRTLLAEHLSVEYWTFIRKNSVFRCIKGVF